MTLDVYPEPTWGFTQLISPIRSALGIIGPSPLIMTAAFIRLLQSHFATADNIGNAVIKDYIWTDSDNGCVEGEDSAGQPVEGSRLTIVPEYARNVSADASPALYVRREAIKTGRVGMQGRGISSLNRSGGFEARGHQVYITGAHSIIASGQSGGEAEALGQEIYDRMLDFVQIIKTDLRLGNLFVESLGRLSKRQTGAGDSAKTIFYTVVRVAWDYVRLWKVMAEAPALQKANISYVTET